MSYAHAVAQLYELGHELARTPSHKFDLAHMTVLLKALDHPQQRFRSVLIAGTNGKGSTAATLASILRAAGHRTGLYTSPHLVHINERIRIDGGAISDEEFASSWQRVEAAVGLLIQRGVLPWHPSFFEILTAMAFEHFARSGIEIAVLEVGMGGRLDATNVAEPLVSVITDIALDHERFLGYTISEIAREKAGIIRPGGTVVLLPQHPEANDVLGKAVLEAGARAVSAVPYMPPLAPPADAGRSMYRIEVLGEELTIEAPLRGRHQLRNIALALAAAAELYALGVSVTPDEIARGIRETRWPGRLQVVPETPEIVLDVAHNPAGAWALRAALSSMYAERRLIFVFGAMRDKAITEMARILFPLGEAVIATRADNPRSALPEDICRDAAQTGVEAFAEPAIPSAMARARELAGREGVVVVTGSIYVVGEAMRRLGIVPG